MKVFSISGRARHGKDTIGDYIYSYYKDKGISIKKYAFGDYLKEIAIDRLNKKYNDNISIDELNYYKNEYILFHGIDIRRYLQDLADELRDENPNIFIDKVIEKINNDKSDVVIVTDTRLSRELKRLECEFSDLLSIKVIRDIENIEHSSHNSETEIDMLQTKYIIHNNSTIDILKQKIYNNILIRQ